MERHGRDRMVVGFTTTFAINSYHNKSCKFQSRSWRGVFDTTLCDKVWQWLATGRWFSPGTPGFSTNKIYRDDITELLLKVALNSTSLTLNPVDHYFLQYSITNIECSSTSSIHIDGCSLPVVERSKLGTVIPDNMECHRYNMAVCHTRNITFFIFPPPTVTAYSNAIYK